MTQQRLPDNAGRAMVLVLARYHGCTTPPLCFCLMVSVPVVSAFICSDVDGDVGSVFVSGSNPNSDYNVGPDIKYPTEYRTERFYPSYYNSRRPQPVGILSQLSYGGPSFTISLDSDDLFEDVNNVRNATVVVVRPGFSTHAMVRFIYSCDVKAIAF